MSKLLTLIAFFASPFGFSETVLWTGTGNVGTVTGSLNESGIVTGDPVSFRMTYNDQAIPEITRAVNFGSALVADSYFPNDLDLRVTITIGSLIWEATVEGDNGMTPYTLFVTEASLLPPERVTATLGSSDETNFVSFPFQASGGPSEIRLEFTSASDQFISSGISSLALNPLAITSASGRILTGSPANQLSFTIDPSSVEIIDEEDVVIAPEAPLVSIATDETEVTLSWFGDIRFRYRVEFSEDLSNDSWTTVETRNGTQTNISRSYPLSAGAGFYRIVAIDRGL